MTPWTRTFIYAGLVMALSANAGRSGAAAEKPPVSSVKALPLESPSISMHELTVKNETVEYTATAAVLPVTVGRKGRKEEGVECRIFFVSYGIASEQQPRPLAFVFNGGPGAASAYLHLGALGPRRVSLIREDTDTSVHLIDNAETWLTFTDLVFVDPVGTGFSRCLDDRSGDGKTIERDAGNSDSAAWGVREDLDAMAAFIRLYLTRYERWSAPRFLVGESYGGFRAAALAGRLQQKESIAVNGVVLVSPVLQFSLLRDDPYRALPWIITIPSYAATARYHEKAASDLQLPQGKAAPLEEVEEFAVEKLLPALASGKGTMVADALSRIVSLPAQEISRLRGRIPAPFFAKRLLRDEERILSLYDGSFSAIDPDPGRPVYGGEDPLLSNLNARLMTAFNIYVRRALRFETDVPYELLNRTVSQSWNWRSGLEDKQGFVGVADNLKEAMAANTDLRVLVAHGVFDLVTPYFGSVLVTEQMSLDAAVAPNLRVRIYRGGHMFYRREASRRAFRDDARELFADFLAEPNK